MPFKYDNSCSPMRYVYVLTLMFPDFLLKDTELCWDYDLSSEYQGNFTETANGLTCQAWASQSPHEHFLYKDDYDFPIDGSAEAAKNYCRDQRGAGRTWCYTLHPDIRWEYCNFPQCTCK